MTDPDCDNCNVRSIGSCMACYIQYMRELQPKTRCPSGKIEAGFLPGCSYSCALDHGCEIKLEGKLCH